MRASVFSPLAAAFLFLATPSFAASRSLEQQVTDALLARFNLDDDETDSLPFQPRYAVVRTNTAGEPSTVAIAYRNDLQLYRATRKNLTPVANSLVSLDGVITELDAIDLNGDGPRDLRLAQLREGATTESYYSVSNDNRLNQVARFASSFAFDLDADGKSELLVPLADEMDDDSDDDEMPVYAIYRWDGGEIVY
jgi:hypothetical protein